MNSAKIYFVFPLFATFVCLGCGTTPLDLSHEGNLSQRGNRSPASENLSRLKVSLNDLSYSKFGKFEMYVFPKLKGAPQIFEVATVVEAPCYEFVKGDLSKKRKIEKVFPEKLAENNERQCAVIDVTSKSMKHKAYAQIHQDDILRFSLYVDDEYRVYGYRVDSYLESLFVKVEPQESMSSGLTMFPVDLPDLARVTSQKKESIGRQMKFLLSGRIGSELRKLGRKYQASQMACSGHVYQYKDSFGAKTKVGWCEKHPWPQFIDNGRYIAIMQPIN